MEHLPADVVGLSPAARNALDEGVVGGIPVVRALEEIERPEDRHDPGARSLLVEALRAGLSDVPDRVQTSLNVLANAGTFCVVTGQQPGFLCAPLFSLYKAMQACRLAHELSGRWGTSVVPIFWNHADDHDVAEVHHSYVLNRNLDVQKVSLAGMSSGRTPLSRIVLDEMRQRLGATRALLDQAFEEYACSAEAVEVYFPRHGETFAGAFTRTMTSLLGQHGLVVVEPDWIRQPLSRALADLVASDPVPVLCEGSGQRPVIDPALAALVYYVDERGRRALRSGGDGFRFDRELGSRRPAELAASIVQDPEAYSAGALLRPLVQDAVFPTCAYVGGWGEIGYQGQLGPARDAFGLPRIPLVPRISCTIVDPDVRTALARHGTDVGTVLEGRGSFPMADRSDDGPQVLEDLRLDIDAAVTRLLAHRGDLASLEPALGVSLKKAVEQARSLVERVVAKAQRVHANNSGKGDRLERRVGNFLFPRGKPQERVLGPLQFQARFGPEWIEELYREFPPVCNEHVAVHLGAEDLGSDRIHGEGGGADDERIEGLEADEEYEAGQ